MELTESIKSINRQLMELFGIDTITGDPIWRVSFSDDQIEKQYGTFTDYDNNGNKIREVTETRDVKKYSWIKQRYILERLVQVPQINSRELLGRRVSYECIYVFQDKYDNPLPPTLEVCQFAINLVYAAQNKDHNMARYLNPEGNTPEEQIENKRKRVEQLENELYGDESGLKGSTITGESIIVPHNYKVN